MIFELDIAEFGKCRGLLNGQGQLEAKAVVEGINPGRIFVDDHAIPSTGLIWLGNNDGFIFIGDENNESFNNEINDFVDQVIFPEAKKVQLEWFEVMGNHDKWNKVIEKVFKHRSLISWNQRVYKLKISNYQYNCEPIIEQGYEVQKISNELLGSSHTSIRNIEFLHSKVLENWASFADFLNAGMGYYIVYKNEIVSICFSGFVVDNVHCINIETLEANRGKKLAQKATHSFVKDCLENDMIPYWDCMEVNKPSIAVAENIGFKNVFNYVGYYFELT